MQAWECNRNGWPDERTDGLNTLFLTLSASGIKECQGMS